MLNEICLIGLQHVSQGTVPAILRAFVCPQAVNARRPRALRLTHGWPGKTPTFHVPSLSALLRPPCFPMDRPILDFPALRPVWAFAVPHFLRLCDLTWLPLISLVPSYIYIRYLQP